MTKALISLHDVGKRYKSGTVALANFELVVRSGEFLTLLGPSGCGKSTALRLMAGLEKPSSGRVERSLPSKAGSIGFVFQEPTLMPWARINENVFLPLRLQGVSKRAARQRVEEVLALVGLEAFGKAYPRELSGGMRMRVSIARALVLRPALLLMDEPFAALDEITRFRLNDDLLRLKDELATTIVFVTHSVYESVYLSTRVVVMGAQAGRIVAEIPIDPDLPRTPDLRVSATYMDMCQRASQALAGAAPKMLLQDGSGKSA
ncbi:MAG: ABC transporter ATP-binding protein [Methylovirgula sp.]